MYCGNCGVENTNTAKFCKECGAQLVAPAKMAPSMQASASEAAKTGTGVTATIKKDPVKIPWKIVGAIAGLVAVIVAVCLIVKANRVINLNDYVAVEYDGYDGYGTANVYVNWQAIREQYGSKLKLTSNSKMVIGKEYGKLAEVTDPVSVLSTSVNLSSKDKSSLKNGDKIAYTWDVSDDAESSINYKLKFSDGELIVSGLPEVETFDPFEGLELTFKGKSPFGSKEVTYNGPVLNESVFMFNKYYGYENGETLTVTIDEDIAEKCAEVYGMRPEPLTKEYVVSGLAYDVSKLDEIPDSYMKSFIYDGSRAFETTYNRLPGDWQARLMKNTYIGSYLLCGSANCLILVYKANLHLDFSNNNGVYDKYADHYWYYMLQSVTLNPDGTITVDVPGYSEPINSYSINTGISTGWFSTKSWTFVGYKTLAELEESIMSSRGDGVSVDSNVDESVAPSLKQKEEVPQESAAEDNGDYILPSSSTVLLTEADINGLTEEECRLARNEIYARHGRRFNDKELQAYFDSKPWYNGTISPSSFNENVLSSIEVANNKLIQDYEKKHGYNR